MALALCATVAGCGPQAAPGVEEGGLETATHEAALGKIVSTAPANPGFSKSAADNVFAASAGPIVAAGSGNHTLAVRQDGAVWAWGNNTDGR